MNCFKNCQARLKALLCATLMALAVLGIAPKTVFAAGETYTLKFNGRVYSDSYTLGTGIDIANDERFDWIVNDCNSTHNYPWNVTNVGDSGGGNIVAKGDVLMSGQTLHVYGPCTGEITVYVTFAPTYSMPGALWSWYDDFSVECTLNVRSITFDANGGAGTMDPNPQVVSKGVDSKLQANAFTREGYEFTGWNTEADGTGTSYADEGTVNTNDNMTLYAQWKAVDYTLTVSNDGNGTAKADKANPLHIGDKTTLEALPNPGFAFDEWEIVSGMPALSGEELTMPASDVEIKAKFAPLSYTVHYEANGGEGDMLDDRFALVEEKALSTNEFTREGYSFTGWKDADGNEYSDGQVVKGLADVDGVTITLNAQWAPHAYTVAYDANGGEGEMADQAFTYDEEQALTACAFTREGYTFAGWLGSDGNTYTDGATVKNLTATDGETLTLSAQWDAIMYTVSFDANGGTGSMDAQQVQALVPTALNANRFTRDGYTFVAWNTKPDGSGVKIADGINIKVDSDVILYAQWKKNPEKKAETKAAAQKNAVLPKTGDVAPVAATAATALAGAAALVAGLRRKRK